MHPTHVGEESMRDAPVIMTGSMKELKRSLGILPLAKC